MGGLWSIALRNENCSVIIRAPRSRLTSNAKVAELVDALDLGSSAARRESSSLSFRTKYLRYFCVPANP